MGKDKARTKADPAQVWLRNCDEETIEPVQGTVKGSLPSWLSGRLTRNGPGKTQYGDTQFNHLFDGSAYIHQFNINDGIVTYQSRFLNSDTYKENSRADRIIVSEFGTAKYPDPCKTLLQRFMSVFTPLGKIDPTDNCVVNVCYFGDQLYALTETCNMRRIHPDTLDTVGHKTRLNNYVVVNTATAHPHVDPDGTVYNMGNSYQGKKGPTYNIIKFPQPKEVDGKKVSSIEQAEIVTSIPCQWKLYPSYYHSFGISENYFIFVEQPYVFNLKQFFLKHLTNKPYFEAVEWYPDQKTKFRLVDRKTGEVSKTVYEADPFLTFHHTNAYEKDGQLVIDLCAMSDGAAINSLMLKNLEDPFFANPVSALPVHKRYILPLDVDKAPENTNLITLAGTKCTAFKRPDKTIDVHGHVMSQQSFDLPRINYKYNTKEYKYAYAIEVHPKGADFSKVVKMDVDSGETWLWFEEGKMVSEPVFVAAPDATQEDQGVVLSSLIDKNDPRFVALLVLDAATWTEMARVEFQARGTVTGTFHGKFASTNEAVHMY